MLEHKSNNQPDSALVPTSAITTKKQTKSACATEPNYPLHTHPPTSEVLPATEIFQTEPQNTSKPEATFVRSKVPTDYEWEDNRPDSPIPLDQLLYDADLSDEDLLDPDYETEFDESVEGDDANEFHEDDWLADYEVDDVNFELQGVDDENVDIGQLQEPKVLDGIGTSDDEQRVARDRVKGYNCGVVELAHKLQVEACEGKLCAQREEGIVVPTISREEGEINSEYEDSEEDIHTPEASDEDLTLDQKRKKRSLLVAKDTDFSKFQWQVGQRFGSRLEFKEAVAKFAIFQGRNLCVVAANKKRQQRIGVRCSEGCPFWLYASWNYRRASFVVKTMMTEHTCTRNMEKNIQLKSTWLAEQLLDVFKARPHWPAKEIIETVRRAYRVIVKKDFAYKVKYYAHRKLHGSMRDHYGKVGRYLEALKKSSIQWADYNDALEDLAQADPLAAEAFKAYNPEVFCRAFLKTEAEVVGWSPGQEEPIGGGKLEELEMPMLGEEVGNAVVGEEVQATMECSSRGGGGSSNNGGSSTRGRGRGGRGSRGGRTRGRGQPPHGVGVLVLPDGTTMTNNPGSSGLHVVGDNSNPCYNFSQASTSNNPF
ncbi:Turripeptide VIII-01 [Bienertia sinuspersici]